MVLVVADVLGLHFGTQGRQPRGEHVLAEHFRRNARRAPSGFGEPLREYACEAMDVQRSAALARPWATRATAGLPRQLYSTRI